MKKKTRNNVIYLVIGIPTAAVLMGIVTLVVAFSNVDPGVQRDSAPMSKTSWRED